MRNRLTAPSAKDDGSSVDSWICSMIWTWKLDEGNIQTTLLGWWLALMAHGDSRVVVSGGIILNKFRRFLERLSQEIEEDQLQGLKFILQGSIPSGHLEKCSKPRDLFSKMIQQGLLGEDNLGNLEKLLTDVRRLDLVKRVTAFRQSESPGNVTALGFPHFSL